MDRLKMHTPDLAEENFRKLAAMFPNAITETKNENGEVVRAIDADVLRQEISAAVVEGSQERYQFTWPDKKKSVVLANQPIAKTLRLDRSKSVGRDGTPGSIDTENIYIEGDNLDALKLLQETYLGKVKMIYIDPPYNTGNDFVYEDDFRQDTDEYIAGSGQFDDQGNRLVQNTESNGRFHTDWLNMLYPRLRIARDLLTDDGIIFISIDDNEVENLKKLCNEVFGDSNFVAIINWKGRGGRQDSRYYAAVHEYILCYAKSKNYFVAGEEIKTGDVYPKFDNDSGRFYKTQLLRKWGSNSRREDRPNLFYPIIAPDGSEVYPMLDNSQRPSLPSIGNEGRWRHGASTMEKNIAEGRVEFVKQSNGDWIAYEKIFAPLEGEEKTKKYTTWIEETNDGANVVKNLFSSAVFDYPKTPSLIVRFIKMANVENGDTVLDFFSGSATTAHAVMQLNAEDGGNRKFILVQLPELTDEKSEARKAGYETICDIGEERIRRAGKKIRERTIESGQELRDIAQKMAQGEKIAVSNAYWIDSPEYKAKNQEMADNLDIGFRVFRVDSSNMQDVYYAPADYEQAQLDLFADNIKPDRTPEDLLFQVMLDLGILLSSEIEETEIDGKKVFSVADGYLIACFDKDVTEETVKAIAQKQPFYAVFRDSGMASDSVATNFEQIFETYSPKTVRRVI